MLQETYDRLLKTATKNITAPVTLTGTEKQIKWANDLRSQILDAGKAWFATVPADSAAPMQAFYDMTVSGFNGIPHARIWIDEYRYEKNFDLRFKMAMKKIWKANK